MPRVDPNFLTSKITGASKIKEMLRRAQKGTDLTLSKDGLKTLILGRVKRRFDARKSLTSAPDSVEQKDPSGRYWDDISESTKRYHNNPNRILYKHGELKKAIHVVRDQMSPQKLRSPSGGGFSIGVRSHMHDVAEAHNRGTKTIPQRRFMGVGKPDVIAVDNWIKRNYATAGIQFR